MILTLHLLELAVLVWIVVLLQRQQKQSAAVIVKNTSPSTAPMRVLLLCSPTGDVQHEVHSNAREFPKFTNDYEYGGTVYRLAVFSDTTARYTALARTAGARG